LIDYSILVCLKLFFKSFFKQRFAGAMFFHSYPSLVFGRGVGGCAIAYSYIFMILKCLCTTNTQVEEGGTLRAFTLKTQHLDLGVVIR